MKALKNHILLITILVASLFTFIAVSCSSSDDGGIPQHDSNQPVGLTTYYPDSGGIATQVIIKGSNFGNDTSLVRVYFNEKKAALISAQGDRLYVLAPKLPGHICTVTVEVGGKKIAFEQTFEYTEQFAVTTTAGIPGTGAFVEGSLATAQFGQVNHLTIDKEGNVFVTERGATGNPITSVLSEKNNSATFLYQDPDVGNVPTVDVGTQIVYVPGDSGDGYFELNPANMWIARKRSILHPTAEQQAAGIKDFKIDWKHSFAFSGHDGMVYTRAWSGQLIKFDAKTRLGQLVEDRLEADTDSYLMFDPSKPEMLYIAYQGRHCIYTYNLITKEHKLFAGTPGKAGWEDGYTQNAEFNSPRQMTIGNDGNLYVADENNHCIRMIDDKGVVTTPIGMPGKSGYVDGTPEVAMLNRPRGLAITEEGDVYIADAGNRCIRKLTLQ